MARFLAGFVLGIFVVLAAGWLFLTQGGMPVATKGGPLPLERMLTGRALEHAIGREADKPAPFQPTFEHLSSGAKAYRSHCAVCHGDFGQKSRGPIAAGMFPQPPLLLPPHKGVTDDAVGETYWKVKNGIRLTGMPGFETTMSDEQLWEVSLMLLKADVLPAQVQEALR